MKKILCSVLSFLFVSISSYGQIEVQDNQTAVQLAQKLTGQGVIVLNPVLNCATVANGVFELAPNGTTNLGIDSGIVLTSGAAATNGGTQGVNGPVGFPSTDNNFPGDPDLNSVMTGFLTKDRCVLEFDFVPAGDTVKFDYVFGSYEYQSFSCSSYNDIFGFFISGPGIAGNQNIAVIPNTTIPICVNSTTGVPAAPGPMCTGMGPGSPFTQYYVDNSSGTSITYYGFTEVMTAMALVQACDTYHLKLAIADGSSTGTDGVLDSGVFLKAGSLNSTGIKLQNHSAGGHLYSNDHAVRGCLSSYVDFNLGKITPVTMTIKYLIEGTAINGQDYKYIADSIQVLAGDSMARLEIKALLAPPTGPRDVTLKILSPYVCHSSNKPNIVAETTVWIYDSLYNAITTPPITICPDHGPIKIKGVSDTTLNYYWEPANLVDDPKKLEITVNPSTTTTYTLYSTQYNAPGTCPPAISKYTVVVEPYPVVTTKPEGFSTVCLTDSFDIVAYADPGGINYIYNYSPTTYLRDGSSAKNRFFAPVGTYTYTVSATTPVAGCKRSTTFTLEVIPPFDIESVTPQDTLINLGDEVRITSVSEGIMWVWDPPRYLNDPMIPNPIARPMESTKYLLTAYNQYGCTDTKEVNIRVKNESNVYIPNAFSPNGDGINDIFRVANIKFEKFVVMRIYNRLGELVFESQNVDKGWDGSKSGKALAGDTYFYYVELAVPFIGNKIYKGDVTLVR